MRIISKPTLLFTLSALLPLMLVPQLALSQVQSPEPPQEISNSAPQTGEGAVIILQEPGAPEALAEAATEPAAQPATEASADAPLDAAIAGEEASEAASLAALPQPYRAVPAADLAFDSLLYHLRPVVVFADSPEDPNFLRQMELLARDLRALELRDVALVYDTDPSARSEWRQKLRPRGFSLVLLDKDLRPVIRKPLPWEVREIVAAIDKFPLRRQEMLERNPAGR